MTPLALAVGCSVGWTVLNAFGNSLYTAAGVFHPVFLAAGFFFSRRVQGEARRAAVGAALLGMSLLAAWALWQAASGEGRANALFETPNTLAAVLNLALAPALVRILYGDARRSLLLLAILLAAALVATLSRGGFVALAAGVCAASLIVGGKPQTRDLLRALGVLATGASLGALALTLPQWLVATPVPQAGQLEGLASTLGGTLTSRAELYRLALSALGGHPWLGIGYLGFHSLFEAGRSQVPSYASENVTYFVHNDYLQTLLELGVPGFVALLAIVALPFWLATRAAPRCADRIPLGAALAGVGAMAVHALGDFPFYVPLCLLLFGALLGEVDRVLASEARTRTVLSAPRVRLGAIGGATLLALLLLPPAMAEAAAAYGEQRWRSGDGRSAAFGFELARRLQPRDWRYPWYAGQFWYAQALQSGRADAAERADQAFAAGVAANPRDPRPLFGRLAVQLRLADKLSRPQSAATLRAWADRAMALAPLNPAVRRDYAAALAQLAERR